MTGRQSFSPPSDPGKKRPGRPPAVENPRQRILDQATRLFADKGYETSTIADLAATMGVSKAAIYHYFQTKQQLYDAIILNTLDGLLQTVRQALADQSSPPARLQGFMTAHARYFERHREGFVAMLVGFSGMDNTEFRTGAMRIREQYECLLREIIADGIADNSFRPVDVEMTTRAVLSMLNWMVRWFKPGGKATAEELVRHYHDLLTGGLEPR